MIELMKKIWGYFKSELGRGSEPKAKAASRSSSDGKTLQFQHKPLEDFVRSVDGKAARNRSNT